MSNPETPPIDRGLDSIRKSAGAHTDTANFISDLSGGHFEIGLSSMLTAVAANVVALSKKGKVSVRFDVDHIPNTNQARFVWTLTNDVPTSMGKRSEEITGATVLFVASNGAVSLAQPSMFDNPNRSIPGL